MIYRLLLAPTIILIIALFVSEDVRSSLQQSLTTCPFRTSTLFKLCPWTWLKQLVNSVDNQGYIPANFVRFHQHHDTLFEKNTLSKYDGTEGSAGLYLAIVGRVFDVSKGAKHYGPRGSYRFFAACDASRSFVTGDFSAKGLTDSIDGLSPQQMLELHKWLRFYEDTYTYVGKVVGTFYDAQGMPTPALLAAQRILEQGESAQQAAEAELKIFPPCNSEWSESNGNKVWCTTLSGGIKRSWAGVPRKYYKAGSSKFRCACVRDTGPSSTSSSSSSSSSESPANDGDLSNPNLKSYDGCQPDAVACIVK